MTRRRQPPVEEQRKCYCEGCNGRSPGALLDALVGDWDGLARFLREHSMDRPLPLLPEEVEDGRRRMDRLKTTRIEQIRLEIGRMAAS